MKLNDLSFLRVITWTCYRSYWVILLIFISVIIKKYKKILILENIVYIGFIIIAGIIFILVYILPVILYLVCKFELKAELASAFNFI